MSFQVTARELSPKELKQIQFTVGHLIETSHQSLDVSDLQLKYYSITDPSYFFVSNFGIGRALLGKNHYNIGVNPSVFDNDISADALKGVLAHELRHTEDYLSGSTLGTLLPIGFKVLNKKSRRQYERKTDLKVVMKGLDKELIAYKKWQYPLLSKKALAIKKLEYLTPKEIELIVANRDEYPDMLYTWLDHEIPLNISDLIFDIKKHHGKLDLEFISAFASRKTRHSINRNFMNRKLMIAIKSRDFFYEKCLLDVYFKGHKNQYFFNDKETFKIKEFNPDKPIALTLRVKNKVKGADFRLYNCQDMEGEGLFFSGKK